MANSTCAAWGARARSTTFARIAGGTTCTTSLRAAKVTHTAPTDGAMTFDSPFSAVLLAVWELGISLSPRYWSERGLFCVVSAKSPPSGGDLSAGGACPSPMRSRWRIEPPSPLAPAHQTTGAPAARRRGRAHTARQAERARPEAGRQTAETAGMQGRAPRAQPTAPQARGTRARPPSPAIISARGRTPQG